MLAARYRKNYRSSPLHCFVKRIIGSCITSMKRNHHICLLTSLIGSNISLIKFQFFIMIFFCKTAAGFDYIFFQIQTYNTHIISLQLTKIMIHGKGEIRLAASKINNCNFSVFWKLRKNIFNKFQKTIQLPKLIIFCMSDFSLFCHNSQINQKRHRRPLFQKIMFLPVMCQHRNKSFLFFALLFDFNGCFSFFAHKKCSGSSSALHLKLPKFRMYPFFCHSANFCLFIILVELLLPHRLCNLIFQLPLYKQRTYLYL